MVTLRCYSCDAEIGTVDATTTRQAVRRRHGLVFRDVPADDVLVEVGCWQCGRICTVSRRRVMRAAGTVWLSRCRVRSRRAARP